MSLGQALMVAVMSWWGIVAGVSWAFRMFRGGMNASGD